MAIYSTEYTSNQSWSLPQLIDISMVMANGEDVCSDKQHNCSVLGDEQQSIMTKTNRGPAMNGLTKKRTFDKTLPPY